MTDNQLSPYKKDVSTRITCQIFILFFKFFFISPTLKPVPFADNKSIDTQAFPVDGKKQPASNGYQIMSYYYPTHYKQLQF